MTDSPKWFDWAREIYSLAQAGITYSGNPYDIERYKRLQEITAENWARVLPHRRGDGDLVPVPVHRIGELRNLHRDDRRISRGRRGRKRAPGTSPGAPVRAACRLCCR